MIKQLERTTVKATKISKLDNLWHVTYFSRDKRYKDQNGIITFWQENKPKSKRCKTKKTKDNLR
jgi:hypothetical protein